MNTIAAAASTRSSAFTTVARNFWWTASVGGMYFVAGYVAWGGTRGAVVSSAMFVLASTIGLVLHYRLPSLGRNERIALILAALLVGEAVLVWQKANLPLSDYTATGNPEVREVLIYLVSALIVGAMSMIGGVWGIVLGLASHYAFIHNGHEEFNFKWVFPILTAAAGYIVSTAFTRLDHAYAELERLANHDHLTGLFNRHRLTEEFERLQRLARETGRALLLVAWDLDDLKRVNDGEGHAAGDAYIRNFAAALARHVRRPTDARSGDAAFRVGGDEFISLHLDVPDGASLIDRVHGSFRSVSAGWVRSESLTLDQALTQADRALYGNKVERKTIRPTAREGARETGS